MRASTSRPTPDLLGAILIGGQSARMGRPKHLLTLGGESLLVRTARVLRTLTRSIVIVGNGEIPSDVNDLPRIADATEISGPMAGILAALRHRQDQGILAVACDMPNLSRDAVEWLLSQRKPGVVDAVIPADANGVPQSLGAVYEYTARDGFEKMAALGIAAPRRLPEFARVSVPLIPPEHRPAWQNANTPDDWQRLTECEP